MRENEYKAIPADLFLNRNGSFFAPVKSSTIEKWRRIGFRTGRKASSVSKNEGILLDGLEAASRVEPTLIDLDQMITGILEVHPGADQEWLSKRLKTLAGELSESGVFIKTAIKNGKQGGSHLFELQPPEYVAQQFEDRSADDHIRHLSHKKPGRKGVSRKAQARIRDIHSVLMAHNLTAVSPLDAREPWSYTLVTQLVERCSRAKQTDKRRHIKAPITLDGEIVFAETAAVIWKGMEDPAYGVITESDAQIILAILSIAMQTINKQSKSNRMTNRISIDLVRLARQLNTGNEIATYRAFQRGFTRVINTEFKLTAHPDSKMATRIREKTGQPGETVKFRLVEKVIEGNHAGNDISPDIGQEQWEPSNNLRYLTFSLADWIWRDLYEGRGWIVHPGLLTERSGLTHKLYNHLKTHSSITHPYQVTGDQLEHFLNLPLLHGDPTPQARRRRLFCKRLWSIWNEHATKTTGFINLDDKHASSELNFFFFDLKLHVRPSPDHAVAMIVTASHSEESLRMLEMQNMHTEQLQQTKGMAYLPAE